MRLSKCSILQLSLSRTYFVSAGLSFGSLKVVVCFRLLFVHHIYASNNIPLRCSCTKQRNQRLCLCINVWANVYVHSLFGVVTFCYVLQWPWTVFHMNNASFVWRQHVFRICGWCRIYLRAHRQTTDDANKKRYTNEMYQNIRITVRIHNSTPRYEWG